MGRQFLLREGLFLALAIAIVSATAHAQQSWATQINNPSRFQVLHSFAEQAVLDRETGLVWERTPDENRFSWGNASIGGALDTCFNRTIGGRKGWRLPTVEELASLVDTTQEDPALPAGHPFMGPIFTSDIDPHLPNFYWTATTEVTHNTQAYYVEIGHDGSVGTISKDFNLRRWCVRTGQGYDGLGTP